MKKIIFLSVTVFSFLFVSAQSNYKITAAKNMIKGTSSLHDWKCVVEKQDGSATINTTGTLKITALNIRFIVKSIKSVKEDGKYYDESMDKNAYKALSAEAFPEIVYTLVSTSNVKTSGKTTTLTATGNLTIAGKTNKITFPVKAIVNGNNVTFTGATKFKMSLFGIKPPTALLGTIKTGDEITIVMNTTYTK
mgnify:FL=1